MEFNDKLTCKDRFELLEKSIIVCSCAYYHFDQNLLSDYTYDRNTRQLMQMMEDFPDVFILTRYYKYFTKFTSGTGYYLMNDIRQDDPDLYDFIVDETNFILHIRNERNI